MAITYLSGERIQGLGGADIAATSTTDYVNEAMAGALHVDSLGDSRDYMGVQVSTGHAAVGKTFSSFTFWTWKDQSPDGEIGLKIITPPSSGTGLGTVKGTSVTTHEANTATGTQPNDGSGTSMTFVGPVDGNGDYITLADGDVVCLWDKDNAFSWKIKELK